MPTGQITWRPHKLLRPPSVAEVAAMDPARLLEVHRVYHEAIENAERDAYRYGFVLPHWEKADELHERFRTLLILGGNRAGKTAYAARRIVELALANPQGLIYCFAQNSEISRLVQQKAIWEALPLELRGPKDAAGNLGYTQKNGFSNQSFVLPNGTEVLFKTYTQFQQNDTIIEGVQLGCREPTKLNIGAWLDEYLIGMTLINRLMFRLATFDAKLLISFTPKDGETETVQNYRDRAVTKERKFVSAGLKQACQVPILAENEPLDAGVIYFHSIDNPWSGYESLLQMCIAKADDKNTLTTLYGIPTKSLSTMFPKFSPEVNVMSAERMAERMEANSVTRYHVIDPAGRKPWFMAWIGVDPTGTWYVYREWPLPGAGDWAEESGGKWVAGEACKARLGWGVGEYQEEIRRLEGDETIFMRYIDPRMGASKYSQQSGGQSDFVTDLGRGKLALRVVAAAGIDEEPGLQTIQDRLAYDEKRPIDASNRPHLYLSESCPAIAKALQEYDGSSSDHPWKDPIDCLRYAGVESISFVSGDMMKTKVHPGGGY